MGSLVVLIQKDGTGFQTALAAATDSNTMKLSQLSTTNKKFNTLPVCGDYRRIHGQRTWDSDIFLEMGSSLFTWPSSRRGRFMKRLLPLLFQIRGSSSSHSPITKRFPCRSSQRKSAHSLENLHFWWSDRNYKGITGRLPWFSKYKTLKAVCTTFLKSDCLWWNNIQCSHVWMKTLATHNKRNLLFYLFNNKEPDKCLFRSSLSKYSVLAEMQRRVKSCLILLHWF